MANVKNYLSKDERSYVATLFIAREAIEKLQGYGMDKKEATNLKTCKTYFDKYSVELFKRVGEGESKKLVNQFSGGEIEIKRNVKARELHELQFDATDVHDLAPGIIESHCRGCHKTGVDAADCSVHKIFVRALVPTESGEVPAPDKLIESWDDYGNNYVKIKNTYDGFCPYKI